MGEGANDRDGAYAADFEAAGDFLPVPVSAEEQNMRIYGTGATPEVGKPAVLVR